MGLQHPVLNGTGLNYSNYINGFQVDPSLCICSVLESSLQGAQIHIFGLYIPGSNQMMPWSCSI